MIHNSQSPFNTKLLHEPLICLGNFLEDFVCSQQGPASIKIFKTATEAAAYAVCNDALAKRDHIPVEEYLGLTAYDIGKIMKRKQAVTHNAVSADTKIFTKQSLYEHYKQSILIEGGDVSIEAVVKRPVYNKEHQVIGLLAYADDITPYVSPFYLFKLYQQCYPTKAAIHRFIGYMGLDHFFYQLPTKRELEVLLTMKHSSASKEVARILRISPKTVDENKARLRDHLKNITLGELMIKLRTRHEIKEDVFR